MATEVRKEIDGRTLIIPALPAWDAFDIVNEVAVMIGPLAGALKGAGKASGDGSVDIGSIGDALTKAMQALPAADRKRLVKVLLTGVKLEVTVGSEIRQPLLLSVIDSEFRGQISTIFKVAAAAAEVNFGDFFGVAKSVFARAKQTLLANIAKPEQASPAPLSSPSA